MVFRRIAITTITGEYQHVMLMPHGYGALHGNAVNNTSVEIRLTIDIDNLTDVRQTAAGTAYIQQSLTVAACLSEVFRTPGVAIRDHHLKRGWRRKIGVVVVGHQLIWKTVVEQFGVENTSLRHKMSKTYIMIFHKHVDV